MPDTWYSGTFPLFQSPQLVRLPLSLYCEGSLQKSIIIWSILYFLMQPLPLLTQRLPSCSAGFGAAFPEAPLSVGDKSGICPSRWGTGKADLKYMQAALLKHVSDWPCSLPGHHLTKANPELPGKRRHRASSELVKFYNLSRLLAWVNAIKKMMTISKEESGIILQWKFPSLLNPSGGKRKCMLWATVHINNNSTAFFHKILTTKSKKCQTLQKYSLYFLRKCSKYSGDGQHYRISRITLWNELLLNVESPCELAITSHSTCCYLSITRTTHGAKQTKEKLTPSPPSMSLIIIIRHNQIGRYFFNYFCCIVLLHICCKMPIFEKRKILQEKIN